MLTLNDIDTIESDDDVSTEDYYLAIQRAINGGSWSLQGSYGRAMMDAITSGRCLLGTARARDYWGNLIPSRTDVQEGTKGSREYVLDAYGADWLELVEAV
jgi:hypothetical protein